jgi:hypothetical protein
MNTPMKHLKSTSLLAGAICLLLPSAHATLLFSDGFNYTAGSNLGGNVNPGNSTAWSGSSTQITVGNSGLTYPGFQGLGGNSLVLTPGAATTTTNEFSAVTSGNIYYSFLIDCTTLPTANNFITSINQGTAPNGGTDAMAIYVGASGATGWKIGVRTTGGGSGATFAGTTLSLNTTYLVVAELSLGATPTASLFLNPFPGNAQPGTASATQSTATAIASVNDVGFKAQSALTVGNFIIDDMSIGTAWEDVTVPEPSVAALAGVGALGLICYRRRR